MVCICYEHVLNEFSIAKGFFLIMCIRMEYWMSVVSESGLNRDFASEFIKATNKAYNVCQRMEDKIVGSDIFYPEIDFGQAIVYSKYARRISRSTSTTARRFIISCAIKSILYIDLSFYISFNPKSRTTSGHPNHA